MLLDFNRVKVIKCVRLDFFFGQPNFRLFMVFPRVNVLEIQGSLGRLHQCKHVRTNT